MPSQHEVSEKVQYVKELLEKDNLLSPDKVVQAVKKKFGTGIARPDVAKIRLEHVGIRFGPRGSIRDREGKRVERGPRPTDQASANDNGSFAESSDRLAKLVSQLQAEMTSQQVTSLNIPAHGPAEAVQTVRRVIGLQ